MENTVEHMGLAIGISDFNIFNSHCLETASNPPDIESMFEGMIIQEEGFIMMHMVRCTIVFNPNSPDSPDSAIGSCLEAECKSAKDRVVCRGCAFVGIGKIRCVSAVSAL